MDYGKLVDSVEKELLPDIANRHLGTYDILDEWLDGKDLDKHDLTTVILYVAMGYREMAKQCDSYKRRYESDAN